MTAHVLLVDDDPTIRGFMEMILRAEGYRVDTARDGREALACVAEQRPDLVLLDLQMPVLDGWQFQAHLRAWGVDIPLVFMTAGVNAGEEAARHGAAGSLAKPFDVGELLELVARLASGRHAGSVT